MNKRTTLDVYEYSISGLFWKSSSNTCIFHALLKEVLSVWIKDRVLEDQFLLQLVCVFILGNFGLWAIN